MNKETTKKPVGRPRNEDLNFERKMSVTISITPTAEKMARDEFGTLGNAVNLAVKYARRIKKFEENKKN